MKSIIKLFWQDSLWPVHQFKDCNKGNAIQKLKSYQYNQQHADILIIPIMNWIILMLLSSIGMILSEHFQMILNPLVYLTAIFAILFTWCLIGAIILSISYTFLMKVNAQLIKE